MSEIAYTFDYRAPENATVGTTAKLLFAQPVSLPSKAIFICNTSDTATVFIGFSGLKDALNATVNKGIAIFPRGTLRLDSTALPLNCNISAVATAADTVVSFQR